MAQRALAVDAGCWRVTCRAGHGCPAQVQTMSLLLHEMLMYCLLLRIDYEEVRQMECHWYLQKGNHELAGSQLCANSTMKEEA